MSHVEPYPKFSRPERVADATVHGIGLVFSIIGTVLLVIWVKEQMNTSQLIGVSVYGIALIGSFLASSCYHFTPREDRRHLLQRIDHAAIYLKIAGTYTPLVILIGSAFAYSVLAIVWVLAVVGAITKLFFWGRQGRWGTMFYVGLGWISLALITQILTVLPLPAVAFLVAGGLIYTAGAVVFSLDQIRFQNAIWHGFVLTASLCFFTAIAMGTLA